MSNPSSSFSIFHILEIRIAQRLGINAFLLGGMIFVVFFGFFLISASVFGARLFDFSDVLNPDVEHFLIWPPAWTAFTISALIGAIVVNHNLGVIRYNEATRQLTEIFDDIGEMHVTLKSISKRQLGLLRGANIFGLLIGALIVTVFVLAPSSGWADLFLTPRIWFTLVLPVLTTLFGRSVALSVIEQQNLRSTFARLRLKNMFMQKPLNIFVRLALRQLLSWMTLIALSVLFFVKGENVTSAGIPWVLVTTFCALWIFTSTISVGRSLMERHKEEKLRDIQHKIDFLEKKATNNEDPDAAIMLLVHLEMERRVTELSDSSFEIPTALRLVTYVLLPIFAWSSKSIVSFVVLKVIG